MKSTLPLIIALVFLVAACDDDTENANNTNNVNNTSNVNNTTATNNVNNTNNTTTTNNTNNVTVDACTSQADLDIINDPESDLSGLTTTCTTDCQANAGDEVCISECVAEGSGLSALCSTCYGDFGMCAIAYCILPCIDPSADSCTECTETNCRDGFTLCSGYDANAQ